MCVGPDESEKRLRVTEHRCDSPDLLARTLPPPELRKKEGEAYLANVRRSARSRKDVDSVLDRLGHVILADTFARGEVRDCPRDLEHAIVGARAERQPLGGGREQTGTRASERAPARQ